MRTSIKFLSRGEGGAVEVSSRLHEGEAFTFGRATDQVLQTNDARVPLQHSRIVASGRRLVLRCKAPAQAVVNGRTTRDAVLEVGDVVQLGPYVLRILQAGEGVDLAVTVEEDRRSDAKAATVAAPVLDLAAVGLRKRPWSWAFFLATLLFGLLLPWAARNVESGNALLRAAHLPSDRAWSSGPLHSSHAALGQKCESCHVRAFEQVTNGACLDCHKSNLHQHVAAGHVSAVSLATRECTSCHVEHDEPGDLVNKDQRLCLDCHADPKKSAPNVPGMQQIADFGTSHPQFRVSMLDGAHAADAEPAVQRVLLDAPGLRERSGLKFPHDKHLDAKGIKTPDGKKVMGCADCHVATRDGHGFEPITMEGRCASCHKLEFDPATPDRTVPHGKPAEVVQALIDHYSGRYLAGYPDRHAAADTSRTISLPSLEASPAARARMLGNARERALVVAKDVFERRMCADCHVVERVDQEEWRVQPVKLTQQWMPAAKFDHAAHGTSLTPCSTCHAAEHSKEAADILMPGIKVCRDCHAGGDSGGERTGKLASTCTTCHGFHGETHPLWQQPAARKALRAGL